MSRRCALLQICDKTKSQSLPFKALLPALWNVFYFSLTFAHFESHAVITLKSPVSIKMTNSDLICYDYRLKKILSFSLLQSQFAHEPTSLCLLQHQFASERSSMSRLVEENRVCSSLQNGAISEMRISREHAGVNRSILRKGAQGVEVFNLINATLHKCFLSFFTPVTHCYFCAPRIHHYIKW